MTHHIHIFGASGSGTTTLGREFALRINGMHLDTDTYYWEDTDPPFIRKRDPSDRIAMILRDLRDVENWVLSGSICSWGEPLVRHFNLAVFLRLDPQSRLDRLRYREKLRYGNRIQRGGDMHQHHLDFMEWAKSYDTAKAPIRSLDLHYRWMKSLRCPVFELDSAQPVEVLCERISEQIAA